MMERKKFDDPKALLKERKQILEDTIRGNNPKRILICSQTRAWPILDAGYKLTEAFSNYDIWFDVMCRCQELYDFDMYVDLGTRFSYKVTEAMGGGGFIVDDEAQSVAYQDAAYMTEEDYPQLIRDGLTKFYFEKVFPQKYGLSKNSEEAVQQMINAMKEQYKLDDFNKRLSKHFEEKYGVGRNTNSAPWNVKTPIDTLCPALRGIRGLARDMRKIDSKMFMDALDVIDNGAIARMEKGLETFKDQENITFTVASTSTTSTFLSTQQFGKFDWPYLKRICDAVVKNNATAVLFPEGRMSHLIEFYQELPAGHFALIPEMEDIKELKKKLPNMVFIGGFPTFYLGNKTKQECIDKAKEIIDEVGYDGKLIFCSDKMLGFANDAKSENMRAVNDFVREYGVLR